tara:strand:+ start:1149 stop:1556 length:408 start_codon:yes stop_codon:yes gene_type:complete
MLFKAILIMMGTLITLENINHINDLKWKSRVLVVESDEEIDFSTKINPFKSEFDERDFIIIYMNEQSSFINNRKMSNYFTRSVLEKIKTFERKSCFYLIGKDGQVKNAYSSLIEIEKIFSDVDKMPMRKFEARKK